MHIYRRRVESKDFERSVCLCYHSLTYSCHEMGATTCSVKTVSIELQRLVLRMYDTPHGMYDTPCRVCTTPCHMCNTPHRMYDTPCRVCTTPRHMCDTPRRMCDTPQVHRLTSRTLALLVVLSWWRCSERWNLWDMELGFSGMEGHRNGLPRE